MLYGILLMFILSCGQLPHLYHFNTIGDIAKLSKTNGNQLKVNLKKLNSEQINTISEGSLYPYPLHKAVCENDYQKVASILQADKQQYSDASDMQVNQKDTQGYLPIHWAVSKTSANATGDKAKHNLKILKLLLHYPNSNQVDKDSMTVLHWATHHKHLNAIKTILKHFSKKSKTKFLNFINQKDNNGLTALHYAVDRDINGTYTEKHLKILESILEHSGTHIDTQDKNGMTVLHWAVANNNLNAVEIILKHAQSTLKQGYKKFIQTKTGINPETGEGGCAAIYWTLSPEYSAEDEQASRERSFKIFNLLLNESEINAQDNQGYTIAHWVVVQGRNDMLKVLIEHGADLSIQDKNGNTALHTTIGTTGTARCKQAKAIENQDFKEMQTICKFIKRLTHKSIVSTSNSRELVLIQYHTGEDDSILTQLLNLPPSRIGFHKKDANGLTASTLERKYNLFQEPIEISNKKEPRSKASKRANYDCNRKKDDMSVPLKKRKRPN